MLDVNGVRVRLLLAKNPAGWAEVLDLIRPGPMGGTMASEGAAVQNRATAKAMDVKLEVFDGFTQRVDAANRLRAWGFSAVNSWYKNSKGRVTQNFPFSTSELWQMTREVNLADYVFDKDETVAQLP